MIYFIGEHETEGPVKIGYSRNNPTDRLVALQTAHWVTLAILALGQGSMHDERALHARFAACRIRGEWFSRTAELVELIGRVRADSPVIETVRPDDTESHARYVEFVRRSAERTRRVPMPSRPGIAWRAALARRAPAA